MTRDRDHDLTVPEGAIGLVLFAHGSGSNRASPRNRRVAQALAEAGLATLLFDLVSPAEGDRRFDIRFLATRLVAMTDRVELDLPIGYFGASTGAAAALVAAAMRPERVRAVVSRGGRPDLAEDWLDAVRAPTLLIVGGADHGVIELNQAAARRLGDRAELRIVPRATHLFEEPGALDEVVRFATAWFRRHLSSSEWRSRETGSRPT